MKLKTDRPRPNWIETALKSHGDASNKVPTYLPMYKQ